MRRLILPFALATVAAAALVGCGQKGPLTYAPPTPATTAKPQAAAPAPASTVAAPATASTTMAPFNSVIHQ